jgi:hypothetical protein
LDSAARRPILVHSVSAVLWWRWRRPVTYEHDAHPMPFGIIRESVSDAIRCRRFGSGLAEVDRGR